MKKKIRKKAICKELKKIRKDIKNIGVREGA